MPHGVRSSEWGIQDAIDAFIFSRKGANFTRRTVEFYEGRLKVLRTYLEGEGVQQVGEFDILLANRFMAYLNESTIYNQGGKHAIFRSVKTLFGWIEMISGEEYRSPMWNYPAPHLHIVPKKGVQLEELEKMISFCEGKNKLRDLAILYFLADTGVRAAELLHLNIEDVDVMTGEVKIIEGKWRKDRTVIIGIKSRKALRAYMKTFEDLRPTLPVFRTEDGDRLAYSGLRQLVRRVAVKAKIHEPGLHDFRRLFAVTMHRNGVDDITLARFMGHSTVEVLKRYLAEDDADLIRVHRSASPVDNNLRR